MLQITLMIIVLFSGSIVSKYYKGYVNMKSYLFWIMNSDRWSKVVDKASPITAQTRK